MIGQKSLLFQPRIVSYRKKLLNDPLLISLVESSYLKAEPNIASIASCFVTAALLWWKQFKPNGLKSL